MLQITKAETKKIEALVNKAQKKENATFTVMQKNGYESMSYDLKKMTLRNISREIISLFNFYPIYYNASRFETLDADRIINTLNSYKTNEKKELLRFVYGIVFKKDNILNFKKDNSKLWEFLYTYLKGKKLNADVLREQFQIIKEYQNGKIDYRVNKELYNYLSSIETEIHPDDKKVLNYFEEHKKELKKRDYYFNHFPVNKVLDLMQKNGIIKEFSDIDCNYVRLNQIIAKSLK